MGDIPVEVSLCSMGCIPFHAKNAAAPTDTVFPFEEVSYLMPLKTEEMVPLIAVCASCFSFLWLARVSHSPCQVCIGCPRYFSLP